jgi:regulator of protease activity HflC (stomatin/prohibitin superfamily)
MNDIISNLSILFVPMLIFLVILLFSGIKVIKQYERGIKFTLGKYSSILTPGLNFVFPIVQSHETVDIRTKVLDVPNQQCITKDNVSIEINAVIYYKVLETKKAILHVKDYAYATSQIAQTTLRDKIGQVDLDTLLTKRNNISVDIEKIVDKVTDDWGIKVDGIELKHIEISQDMRRVMARAAEAERESKSIIIKSYGELDAAKDLVLAAKNLSQFPGGLHLRTLQAINLLSASKTHAVVLAMPKELLEFTKKFR